MRRNFVESFHMRKGVALNAFICRRAFFGTAFGLGAFFNRRIFAMAFSEPVLSVTSGGVTFTFAERSEVGTYLDGGIVPVVGPVTVSSYTPARKELRGAINGATLNHVFEGPRNWDGRSIFSSADAAQPNLPITLKTNDIFIVGKSNLSIDATDRKMVRNGVIEEYAALVVVDSLPSANKLAPPLISWVGRSSVDGIDCDIDAFLQALPRFVISSNVPSASEVLFFLDKLNLGPSISNNDSYSDIPKVNTSAYEMWTPANSAIENGSNYGAGQAAVMDAAGLLLTLHSTHISNTDRRAIAIRLAQCGRQWYETLTSTGELFNEGGAHFQFHLIPMMVYLASTGQYTKLSTLIEDTGGSFTQCFKLTSQMLIDAVKPHDSDEDGFWFTKRRAVTAVNGNQISVFAAYGGLNGQRDPGKIILDGMTLIRESDGASAMINSTVDGELTALNDELVFNIDAQPGAPFAPNDVITFGAAYPLIHDAFDWAIRSNYSWRWFIPSKLASYRKLNNYSASALFAQIILNSIQGLKTADFDELVGYTWFSNEDAVLPTVHSQFTASETDGGVKYQFVGTYWKELASKIVGVSEAITPEISNLTITAITQTSATVTGEIHQDGGIVYVALTDDLVEDGQSIIELVEQNNGVYGDTYLVKGNDKSFQLEMIGLTANTAEYFVNVVQRDAVGNVGEPVSLMFATPDEAPVGEFDVVWRGLSSKSEDGPYKFANFQLGANPADRELIGAIVVRGGLNADEVTFDGIAATKLPGATRENAHQRIAFWSGEPSGIVTDVLVNMGGARGAFAGWSAVKAVATGYNDGGSNPFVIIDIPPGAKVIATAMHTQGVGPKIKGLSNIRANESIEGDVTIVAADDEFKAGSSRHIISLGAVKNAMLVVVVLEEHKR